MEIFLVYHEKVCYCTQNCLIDAILMSTLNIPLLYRRKDILETNLPDKIYRLRDYKPIYNQMSINQQSMPL